MSRTYNAADADTKGTFGLSVPAVSVASGVRPASAAEGGNFLADLRHDASFRTNLVVANLKDEAQSWYLDGEGVYTRRKAGPGAFSAHTWFMTNPSLSGRGRTNLW